MNPPKIPTIEIFSENSHIITENTVFILENEYAITHVHDKKHILLTDGISGYEEMCCIGTLLYDPFSTVGSLVHLLDNEKFSSTVDEVIKHMKIYGGRRFVGFIVRLTENPLIKNQIQETQEKLLKNRTLIKPFSQIEEQTVVFDTKDAKFYKRPSDLYPSIEDISCGRGKKLELIRGDGCYYPVYLISCCYEPREIVRIR